MRRSNASEIRIKNPGRGVLTRVPSNFSLKSHGQYWSVAKNVRAQAESTETAGGLERVVPKGNIPEEDESTNLIAQRTLSSGPHDFTKKELTVIGTSEGLYAMAKESQTNLCHPNEIEDPGGGVDPPGGSIPCEVSFAYFADSGYRDDSTQGFVREILDIYPVDFIVHSGDFIYSNSPWSQWKDIYEEAGLYYWADYVKGYGGPYGVTPTEERFFCHPNNHEYTDWPSIDRFREVFNLPADAVSGDQGNHSYTFKRGPCQFWLVDLYGPCCKAPPGVGQLDVSSTSPVAQWVQAGLAASNATWKIVVLGFPAYSSRTNSGSACGGSSPYCGYQDLRWPFSAWGAHVVLAGDTHYWEHIQQSGVDHFTCGNGGAPLDADDGTIQSKRPDLSATSLSIIDDSYGLLRIEASQDKLICRFHSYFFGDPYYEYTRTRTVTGNEVCFTGTSAKAVQSVVVRPIDDVTMEVGQQWPFKCIAFYADGDWDDVTSQASWTSNIPSIAAVGATSGIVTGVGTGTAIIRATFRGKTDFTNIEIVTACVGKPRDYFLVVENTLALEATAGLYTNRMEKLKQALTGFVDSLGPDDRVNLVVSSGNWQTQVAGAPVKIDLTDDFASTKTAIAGMTAQGTGNCVGNGVKRSLTSITDLARAEADQHMIIFLDTLPNISPGGNTASLATSQADAMTYMDTQIALVKDAGVCVSVVVLDVFEQDTWTEEMTLWADNPANIKWLTTSDQLYGVFIQFNNIFCGKGCQGEYYIIEPPNGCVGTDPRLNFPAFNKWNVVQNEVDLIGIGNTGVALFDVYKNGTAHGQGLYVDLAGSGPNFYGKIQMKTGLNLVGYTKYRIRFKLAGNWREANPSQSVRVVFGNDIGPFIDDTITITDFEQEFTEYTYDIRPSLDVLDLKLSFEMLESASGWSAIGILLDDIVIENLDTSTILFQDNFDNETC